MTKTGTILAKAITICVAGMILGFGLCSGVLVTHVGHPGTWSKLAVAGVYLFFASLAGIAIIGLIALIRSIAELFSK